MTDSDVETQDGDVVMYRPTGPEEYALVAESGFREWPPRLEGQPIFYPVENERYAREITEQWNVRDSGVGHVFRFVVREAFASRYALQQVGGGQHVEWWIPAEDLDELNANIVGEIEHLGSVSGGT